MREDQGSAQYVFMVQLVTNDYDIVNSFGYKSEDRFIENIRRKIMRALAEHPHLTSIDVDVVDLSAVVEVSREQEEVDDDEY